MSAEETAEVILIVIRRLLKWFAFFAIGVITLIGSYLGYKEIKKYYSYELPKEKIEIHFIEANKGGCAESHPYLLAIKNKSDKKIMSYSFRLSAYLEGRSTNLASYDYYSNDKIIEAGQNYASCIAPKLSIGNQGKYNIRELNWRLFDFHPNFSS